MAEVTVHIAGEKGVNRVRVYRRTEAGGRLYIEWRNRHGRKIRRKVTTASGRRVLREDRAIEIAEDLAAYIRKKHEAATLAEIRGGPEPHTLDELLAELHAARGPDWSAKYRKDQERARAFWTRALGKGRIVTEVQPTEVERIARTAAERNEWSDRTRQQYLRYLVDAYYFGQRKLKFFGERHNLSAVDMPKARGRSRAYTLAEASRIMDEAPSVDLRLAAVCEIAFQTGRRLNAIRTLPADAYRTEARRAGGDVVRVGVLTFPGETDKARETGEAVIVGSGQAAVEMLRQTPAVEATGRLFPKGDLQSDRTRRGAVNPKSLNEWLRDAERRAKVAHVDRRAFHGFKRLYATLTDGMAGRDRQSGTLGVTLDRVYRQDALGPKVALAAELERRRREAAG